MAESAEAPLSLEGIFKVLQRVPGDRLLSCAHRLSGRQRDRRPCQLLRAMIQLTLKQEAEARASLEALGEDALVAQIFRSHWGSAERIGADPVLLNQEALVVVAQIYSLLEEERFCLPQVRDEAYREAIKAVQVSGIGEVALKSLWNEALEKCGPDFTLDKASHPLASQAGSSLTAGSSALASSSWEPVALRSTGSPVSLISHFEISQSLTAPFVTNPPHQHGVPETGELNENAPSPSTPTGKAKANHSSLSESPVKDFPQKYQTPNRGTDDAQGSHSSLLVPAHPKVAQPGEAEWHTLKSPEPHGLGGGIPGNRPPSPTSRQGSGASPDCIERGSGAASSPAQSTGPGGQLASSSAAPPPPPPAESSWTDSLSDEKQFFTFMVLHASEDEAVARQVKERLESMGVSNGATFCEDFLLPGRCQLSCFQDALENSAFTLLLLTENFRGRLCAYQTSVALMDSFTRFLKSHSVIPFMPKKSPLQRTEMPILLAGLVPLDENSPVFAKRVKKTFTAAAIREKKAIWTRMRQLQEQEEQRQFRQALRDLSVLSMSPEGPVTFPMVPGPPGHVPQLPFHPGFPAPGPSQSPAGPGHPHSLMFSVSGGPPPQLIIQNAQMVQIGDYNHMHVEGTSATLSAAAEDGQVGGAVGSRQGDAPFS
ncbi:TIR domain-containing adapter molecule 1 [Varanus komodoensis]|uniref:TIR domain-containing adapter molecule 1 n=1 Tax=Varanus komodoensis TaxID=61221 RepID=A0A8D2LR99_VARKO|nr:TIR domain-containing adapter molecule 1 [Varanus komodoensis]